MFRRLYGWILHWAETPYGSWALFLLAFAESSFFPIPPDPLLIALAVARPRSALKFALVCSIGSVLGGCFGYLIGWQFMAAIGDRIVALYGLTEKVAYIEAMYNQYDAWAVAIAGFTPIPYKVFTIAAGAFKINFPVFVIASMLSRSARFFIVGGLIRVFGEKIQAVIEKYFDILVVAFTILLIGGFVVIKYVL